MAGPGRVRRVQLRTRSTDAEFALDMAAGALLAATSLTNANGHPFVQWGGEMKPSHFFELGPSWVVGTHYANWKAVGRRVEFPNVTASVWIEGTNPKRPRNFDFDWHFWDEDKIQATVHGPTLGKAIEEMGYLFEIRQLLRFAHEDIEKRLAGGRDD